MHKFQINTLIIYLLLTFLLVVFGILYPSNQKLWLLKYITILSLFLISIIYKSKGNFGIRLPFALLFATIGDASLYLALPLKFLRLNIPLGLFSFSIAYVIIAAAYLKPLIPFIKSSTNVYLKQFIFIILTVTIIIYFLRKTRLDYLVFGSIFIFALLIVFFCALNLFFSTLLSKSLRFLILISATLMMICDIGVILGFLLPILEPSIYTAGMVIVWSAYIPAWTIICVISMEKNLNDN